MKLLIAIFIAAIFVIGIGTTVSRNTSTQNNSVGQLGNITYTPKAGQPLTLGYLELSTPPILSPIIANCDKTVSQNQLSWNDIGASPYLVYRDNAQLASISTTTFTDSTAIAGQTHCYIVQGSQSSTIKTSSNKQCLLTKFCGALATSTGTPTPTPTITTTLTPTPTIASSPTLKPSPTTTAIPTYCQSSTKTADGKSVISVASFGNNIQAAIDCFKDQTGGAVYIPAGNYTIPEKIKIYSNVTLFGDSANKPVIRLQNSKRDSAIGNDTSKGQTNIVIRDLIFNGPGTKGDTCCHGVKLENLNGGFIINVESNNWGLDGFYLGYKSVSGSLKGADNIRITGCRANNNDRNGISLTQNTNTVIDNCQLEGNNIDPQKRASAIDLEPDSSGNTSNNKILNNRLFNNKGNGIGLGPNPNEPPPPGIVTNNAVCFNTTRNNDFAGISGYRNNFFVNNDIQNNDGFESANCSGGSGCATSPSSACTIPANLANLPARPPVPGAVQGTSTSLLDWLMQFFKL